jgi:hypothetical protein
MNRSIRKVVFVVVLSSFMLNLITARRIDSGLKVDMGVTSAEASGATSAQSLTYNMPYTVQSPDCKQSNNSQLSDFDNFSWQSFIALNWPAALDSTTGLPARSSASPNGVPDTTKSIGDSGPRTWEGLKADFELFQANGAPPSDWTSYQTTNPPCGQCGAQAKIKLLPLIAKGQSTLPGGINQAMAGPLLPQQLINGVATYLREEVRVNEVQYNAISNAKWYLRSTLPKYPKPAVNFTISNCTPQPVYGALEVKASWRQMTPVEMSNPAITSRYYIVNAVLVDPVSGKCTCTPVPMGLVGFHIGQKTSPFTAWMWSTFEQVDNVPCTPSEQSSGAPECASAPPEGYSFNNGTTTPNASTKGYAVVQGQPNPLLTPFNPKNSNNLTKPVQVLRHNDFPNMGGTTPPTDRTDILQSNATFRNLLKGTTWYYYKLVSNQWAPNRNGSIVINNPATTQDNYSAMNSFPLEGVANTTMETYFQVKTPFYPNFGSSCIHCHYQAAQTDFSWVLADMAYPANPGAASSKQKGLPQMRKPAYK